MFKVHGKLRALSISTEVMKIKCLHAIFELRTEN